MKGLKGDGHGGWYDAKGKFVAKTVNGKLQFVQGGSPKEAEGPTSTKPPTPQTPKQSAPAPVQQQAAPAQQPVEEPTVKDGKAPEEGDTQSQTAEIMGAPSSEGAVVVFGRFNPPTTGHEKLIKSAHMLDNIYAVDSPVKDCGGQKEFGTRCTMNDFEEVLGLLRLLRSNNCLGNLSEETEREVYVGSDRKNVKKKEYSPTFNEILKRCQYISKPLSLNSDRSEQYVGYITDIIHKLY